jgi:hypothetical protein
LIICHLLLTTTISFPPPFICGSKITEVQLACLETNTPEANQPSGFKPQADFCFPQIHSIQAEFLSLPQAPTSCKIQAVSATCCLDATMTFKISSQEYFPMLLVWLIVVSMLSPLDPTGRNNITQDFLQIIFPLILLLWLSRPGVA